MSLNIHGTIIAEIRPQSVNIQRFVGAYALQFGTWADVRPSVEAAQTIMLHGAHVSVGTNFKGKQPLGDAWTIMPTLVQQKDVPISQTPAFRLPLSAKQIEALEIMRDGGDLEFHLDIFGLSDEGDIVEDSLRYAAPRSVWIHQLRQAGARNVLLLEVPLPFSFDQDGSTMLAELRYAENHFSNGNYRDCIAACRHVVEEIGRHAYDLDNWSGPILDRLASHRRTMSKGEREACLWATVRHYAHQAHHSETEGGAPPYSRTEAQFIFTLTAQLAARCA